MSKELTEPVSERANALLGPQKKIKLLEAGCGSASHVHFNAAIHAVGIDISEEQLRKNADVQEKYLGDIQQYPLPRNEFDVVICWEVLEHLERPQEALLNLFSSVRPGGLVILAFPNLVSIKGLVTKLTPHWFHILFYKFMRYTFRPFPTFFRATIIPKRVVRFAQKHGFSVEFFDLSEGRVSKNFRRKVRVADWGYKCIDFFTRMVSFGKLQSMALDACVMILQKDQAADPFLGQHEITRSVLSR